MATNLREDKEFFTKHFEKTGCLMTVDRSGDEKIQPHGLKDHVFKSRACVASHIAILFQC